MTSRRLDAELILGGAASAPLLVLREPVSFWGGVDDQDGTIIDRNHPQQGTSLAGTALLMDGSRGSSSSSSTFLECVRLGTAPAILLFTERDTILTVAAAAAWEIYGTGPTVLILPEMPDLAGVHTITVDDEGVLHARSDVEETSASGGRT
ncbi:aconitase X swivel domain-containing protein [Rhodococcus sp. NPDC056960]|uniref:aconitase X swivel domain-containing protein n=1 Tax=Rhodococcus sp. NPDC056960 TaxID=3345982 RepID=UPI003644E0EA